MVNVEEIKTKIMSSISERGPSLPVHVSKAVGIEPMLASAILSELLKERKIKLSNLRVGSSPLYLIPGQEAKLENFIDNLNHVEREAFKKLKDNKILDDEKQEPKIRVALRQIKDFAIPVQSKGKTLWKFFTVPNEKIQEAIADEEEIAIGERVIGQKILEGIHQEKINEIEAQRKQHEFEIKKQKLLEVEEEAKKILEAPQTITIPTPKEEIIEIKIEKPLEVKPKHIHTVHPKNKQQEKFLEEIQASLINKNIELISIEEYNQKQIIAKIRFNSAPEQITLLFAYDKKRVDEKDVIKAHKKASLLKLPFFILCKGEISKKMQDQINAYKALTRIDII